MNKINNNLKYGKNCIGQTVINNYGETGLIVDMYTETDNHKKCMVKIMYPDGTWHCREKHFVNIGSFKKPYKFDLKEDLKNGFKPVYGWEDYYIINKYGVIKTIFGKHKGKIKRQSNRWKYSSYRKSQVYKNPYKAICLYKRGKETRKNRLVHTIMVETFIRTLKKGEQVNHINGISSDNRLINLEIVNRQNNNKKYRDFGFLSEEEIKKLDNFCWDNNMNYKEAIHCFVKSFLTKEVML